MESSTMVLQNVPSNDSMDLSESSTFSQDNNDPNDPSLTLTSPSLEHKSNGNGHGNGNGIRSPTDVRSYRHEHERGHGHQEGDRDHEYDRMDSLDLDQSLARLGDLPIVREGSILDEEDDNKILMNASDSSDEDSGDDEEEDSDDTDYRGNVNVNVNGYRNHNHNNSRHNDHHNGSDNHMREREYDDEVQQQYLEYQKEQEELHKEMNLNKVAFAAYRTAVLHLVHNQASFPKNSFNRKNRTRTQTNDSDDDGNNSNEDEKDSLEDMTSGSVETYDEYGSTFDDNDNDNDTTNTEDEANQRMTMLEEIAKEIVETKARACFEAVIVAQDFVERRDEKRQRRRMLLGGLAGVGGQDNILAELRKMKDLKKNKKAAGKASVKTEVTVKKTEVKAKVEVKPSVKKTVTKPSPKVTTHSTKKSTPSGPIVRLKKTSRHPDCIKDTLPKFEYKKETDENDGPDNGVSKPATYRTTSWIQNMVKWRIERNEHEEANLTKCGCPDCLVDLKKMYDKKDASSSLYSVKSLLK
jgi:hypothetical protein